MKNDTLDSFFSLKVSDDKMSAFIPAKDRISRSLLQLSYDDFVEHFLSQGYKAKPSEETFEKLKKTAALPKPYFKSSFEVLSGVAYHPGEAYKTQWINQTEQLERLVFPGVPFLKLIQAQPPQAELNIFGEEKAHNLVRKKNLRKDFILADGCMINRNNEVYSDVGGYACIEEDNLIIKETYVLDSCKASIFEEITFPCSIHLKDDLEGPIHWIIEGDLTVDGHWAAPHVEVHGNAFAEGGIHTNTAMQEESSENTIFVQGNLYSKYIQMSRLRVEGKLTVENSLSSSKIESGTVICQTSCVISSSEIVTKGSIHADSVLDNGNKATSLIFKNKVNALKSNISHLPEGTRLTIEDTETIVKDSGAWPIKS